MTTPFLLLATMGFGLLVVSLFLAREVRLRRALERLLAVLLSRWRKLNDTKVRDRARRAAGRDDPRL